MLLQNYIIIAAICFTLWSFYGFCKCLMKVNFEATSLKELKILPIIGCVLNLFAFSSLPILLDYIQYNYNN